MALHLFLSDLHFGAKSSREERLLQQAFGAWIDAHLHATSITLLGDFFDAYIEYEEALPKVSARVLGALARYADAGGELVVMAGNHDPWHRTYFEEEFGATFVADVRETTLCGHRIHAFHGDGLRKGTYTRIRPLLRHPVPVWVYQNLIPVNLGMKLARWFSGRSRHAERESVLRSENNAIRRYAERVLARREVDIVLLGHTHRTVDVALQGGRYLNAGDWRRTFTHVEVTEEAVKLVRWNPPVPLRHTG